MPILEAFRHVEEDRPYANCASAVVHALAPKKALEVTTSAVLFYNAQSLVDIASCLAYEQARVGNYVVMDEIREGMDPSDFFRNSQRLIEQRDDGSFFAGGLLTTVEQNRNGESELHVIGVMSHHKGNKEMFTVCDTSKLRDRKLIRRMTAREMDSRIVDPTIYSGHRALTLFGYPLEEIRKNPKMNGNFSEMENEMLMAEYRLYECLDRIGLLYLAENNGLSSY